MPIAHHGEESDDLMSPTIEPMQPTMDPKEESKFAELLEEMFPRAVPEAVFVDHMSEVLNAHGYNPKTSINLVSTCRDELCRPFTEHLDAKWGSNFDIGSLAGFVFCGRTGFKAAMAHAPVVNGKERYVFWVAPHIALSQDGQVGKCMRVGRSAPSSACGALLGVMSEIKSGAIGLKMDPTDVEYSLCKQEIIGSLSYGQVPSLVELTYTAYNCILNEVKTTAIAAVSPENCEYVIVAGIQVHGPNGQNFYWPGHISKWQNGTITDLSEDYFASVSDWHIKMQGWSASEALMLMQKRRREARLATKEGDLTKLKRTGVALETVKDNHQRTLLHVAAKYNRLSVAEFLVEKFPSLVTQQDMHHLTALDYAIDNNAVDMAELLHKHGAGLSGENLRLSLTKAVEKLDLAEFARIFKYASDKQEALHATDKDGRSLVHICVDIKEKQAAKIKQQEDLISSMLSLGMEMTTVDNFGNESSRFTFGSGTD